MTKDEITKIAKIMISADGFCSSCGGLLLDNFRLLFPDFSAEINAVSDDARGIETRYRDAIEEWDYGPPESEPRVWNF